MEGDGAGPSDAPHDAGAAAEPSVSPPGPRDGPPACIVIGMAGSGKTTLVQRLAATLSQTKTPGYFVNLDPAVHTVPYAPNIDIRDSVKIKEVMKEHRLGPNGGILTSLNLFCTRFDQVLNLVDKRRETVEYFFFDTPGQIEVFAWSASGSIISESLAMTFPTVVLFVVDTPRSQNPSTFISSMLYACSILYKTRLPLVMVFNKADVVASDALQGWMRDYELFEDALQKETTFASSLTRSMALALDQFYSTITAVEVSAVTGEGINDLLDAIQEGKAEFLREYKPDMERRIQERRDAERDGQMEQLNKFRGDRRHDTGWAPAGMDTAKDGEDQEKAPMDEDDDDDEDKEMEKLREHVRRLKASDKPKKQAKS